jgi:hypothetical protein
MSYLRKVECFHNIGTLFYSNQMQDREMIRIWVAKDKDNWLNTFHHDTQNGSAIATIDVTSDRLFQSGPVCLN